MEITSKSNEKVKYIKSLNEKKFRQKYNAFYIEGVKVILELLDIYVEKAIDIEFIAYSMDILKNTNGSYELLNKLKKIKNIETINMSEDVFYSITDTVNSQGILCVIKTKNISICDFNLKNNILIIDKVQDSGNIGTIIRTATAFGIDEIILNKGTADVYSPKVIRSTMLSILKCKIYISDNIEETIKFLKQKKFKIISTSLYESEDITNATFKEKCAIVVGNEANGVDKKILDMSDLKVKIPIKKDVESLNVASATSIILYMQYITGNNV